MGGHRPIHSLDKFMLALNMEATVNESGSHKTAYRVVPAGASAALPQVSD